MAHLLLIEDDPTIRSALIRSLTSRGHSVDSAADAMSGLQQLVADPPDAVVLDLGLPDLPGERLLGMIRAVNDVPVVVATARDDEGLVVRLLDAGADDYVVKPFDPSQLEARVRAVLRRSTGGGSAVSAPPVHRVGGLTVDPSRHVAELDGRPLDLTPLEFDLLAYLAANPGRVVTRRELMREVWQRTDSGRTVDVHLSWLRRKLGESAEQPRLLHTVRGVGVRLEDGAAS
jgi:two-component system KDP operon response regulator KdpE